MIHNLMLRIGRWRNSDLIEQHVITLDVFLALFVAVPLLLIELAYAPLMVGDFFEGFLLAPLLDGLMLVFQCLPWLIVAAIILSPFAIVTAILQFINKRIRVSAWIPRILAVPIAAGILSSVDRIPLLLTIASTGLVIFYWLVFQEAEAIAMLRIRTMIAGACAWGLILVLVACFVLIPQYLQARRAADAYMSEAIDGPWTRSRVAFSTDMNADLDAAYPFLA